MATRLISKTWKVEGVLTDVTSAKLSDPTGTYGVKRNDTDAVVVADDTSMTKASTGTYEYSFTDVQDVSYTAYVEIVYLGGTYYFETDIPARTVVPTMLASYSSLLERVGHFLFGIRSGFSSDQTTDIEDCIHDGLNEVYSAHSWSFFRPVKELTTTAPYSTGTITIASGVVTLSGGTFPSWAANGVLELDDEYYDVDTRDGDTQITLEDTSVTEATSSSYELGRHEYDMPTGFEDIAGNELHYEPGQSDFYPPIRRRHDSQIRSWRQDDPYNDRPIYFSVRTAEFDPTVGSRRNLVLYPTPDAAYVIKVPMYLRWTMIDSTNEYPVGGERISQLILEACLAAAEDNFDEENKRHRDRYEKLLPSAIAMDMEITSPTSLGPDASRDETTDTISRSIRMGAVTFNGVEM